MKKPHMKKDQVSNILEEIKENPQYPSQCFKHYKIMLECLEENSSKSSKCRNKIIIFRECVKFYSPNIE